MTLDEVFRIALRHFPECYIGEDVEGQVVIYTQKMIDDNQELIKMPNDE